jgi:signal transduction histidine kinase
MTTTERMTETTTVTTDGHPATFRSRVREHARAVRTRITTWVVLVTALALLTVGVTSYLLETNRIDDRIRSAINQEMREFEQLRTSGIDPETRRAFTSADRLITVALQRNAPEQHELLLGIIPGRAPQTSSEQVGLEAADRTAMLASIDAQLPAGGFARIDTSAGEVLLAVKPVRDNTVRDGEGNAAYVVAYFRDLEQAQMEGAIRTYALVALLALLLVAVGSWMTAGRLLRPVRELRDTARDISDTDLSRRIEVTGDDDLSDLARTFNAMLDRLERSFAMHRSFLDDAGHELRTPITIVRGHLEVADPTNPEDMESTRALVLDELDRMGRLVDDLIVLAKSGQPDFVRTTPVDAAALTDDVLDKVRALGDRRWVLDQRAEWVVPVDPQRITQALVQLATNAVQHTAPGDEIAVGSAVQGGQVGWWVRDNGPGVQPGDVQRIFDRFQRGRQTRGHEGSGLGLSIVRAIAQAHGGDVLLDSEPGAGAAFTVVIPLSADAVPQRRAPSAYAADLDGGGSR